MYICRMVTTSNYMHMYLYKITDCLPGKHRGQSTQDSQASDIRDIYMYMDI